MFCPNCGNNNPQGTQFCAACGAQLSQVAPQQSNPVVQPAYVAPVPGKGLGIASMVLGIVALGLFCMSWVALTCALVGCILGGVALAKAKAAGVKNGMAVAGLVCSVIALALDAIVIIVAIEAATEFYALFGM